MDKLDSRVKVSRFCVGPVCSLRAECVVVIVVFFVVVVVVFSSFSSSSLSSSLSSCLFLSSCLPLVVAVVVFLDVVGADALPRLPLGSPFGGRLQECRGPHSQAPFSPTFAASRWPKTLPVASLDHSTCLPIRRTTLLARRRRWRANERKQRNFPVTTL